VDIDVPSAVDVFTTALYTNLHLLTYLLVAVIVIVVAAVGVRGDGGVLSIKG